MSLLIEEYQTGGKSQYESIKKVGQKRFAKSGIHKYKVPMSKNNIRKIITDRGLTVPEAARLCGLPVPTVSAHYYGQRKTMTLPIAAKYAAGFGVEMGELFKGGDAARTPRPNPPKHNASDCLNTSNSACR